MSTGDGLLKAAAGQVPDIIGYLYEKYLDNLAVEKERDRLSPHAVETAPNFVYFAREYLNKNPPTNPTYVVNGLGVRMANGDYVSLGSPQQEARMRDEGIPITVAQSAPGMHGITDTAGVTIMGRK